MTDMMNMAINDMELDNVTGGATRTVKNNSLNYANVREGAGLTARKSKRPATRSKKTVMSGMRSRLRTVPTMHGSRAA